MHCYFKSDILTSLYFNKWVEPKTGNIRIHIISNHFINCYATYPFADDMSVGKLL